VSSRNPLADRRVALGVSGSIAAYKAITIASSLTQQGALVDVVMTSEAAQLVQPLSFQAITHRPVALDMFHLLAETEIGHVSIGQAADAFVVAPATAHTIAKLALGLADDMVTTTALTTRAPCLIAPAMETGMWRHPATQEHVATLGRRGWHIIEPEAGHLASGATGEGRLAPPELIVDMVKHVLAQAGDLTGWRVVVTAGGTREPVDPVRYISNRSSGKMGYAIAEAARDRGADVTLISTTGARAPVGVTVVAVERAVEMRDAVVRAVRDADVLVMAAAVADYQPVKAAASKIKKRDGLAGIDLAPTPDILAEVGASRDPGSHVILVGFAAETNDLIANARTKLTEKRLDLLVANDVTLEGSGFGTDTNKVTILDRAGRAEELPLLPKGEVAHLLWDRILDVRASRAQ
jgi:phosphopantothenoylcysteine decarboxylase / phosphopantothenate---cysteine ligase